MVWAVQIWVHGEWRTVAVNKSEERAGVNKVSASNVYDADARVKTFPSEREAWA